MTKMPPPDPALRWGALDEIGTSATWLEAQIEEKVGPLNPSAGLAIGLRGLTEFRKQALADETFKFSTADETYDYFMDAIGADFVSKALHWGWECGFRPPADKWELLRSGDPNVARPGVSSSARNQVWELVIAALASTFATDVCFEEPDVCCSFEGKRVAIAAKVVYSEAKVPERILEGFSQADGKADASLVFLDVVKLYPQVDTFRLSHARRHRDGGQLLDMMVGSVNRWCERWDLAALGTKIGRRATQPVGVAFFVPMLLHVHDHPVPFFYTHMPLRWPGEGVDYAFTTAFLRACNQVLGYRSAERTVDE